MTRSRPGRAQRAAGWACVCLAVVLCLCCAAWAPSHHTWLVDVLASFTFQSVATAGVVLLVSLALRAWGGVCFALIAVALGAVGMTGGRSLTLGDPPAPGAPALRVLVFNPYALNEDRDACFALVERADADIVVLIEPEIEFSRSIRWDGALEETYPRWVRRDWVRQTVSPIIVLSRLPMRELDAGALHPPDEARFLLGVEVESAIGPVVIAAAQPRSPRTAARWAAGNREAALQAEWVGELRTSGHPVVLCADLNSTPTAHRGSILRGAGLTPAKPLLTPEGTYPAALPWPAQIALDDAWHTPDLTVASWRTVGNAGSDHEAVLVEFVRSE
ncbi:MAG: hypothetical protein RIB60_00140 [Phycisphaerales bacterium]